MTQPFTGEIRIFPYNFAPRGWADCNGQLLPIAQNTALFSLFGTTYGGDGRTTMGVPSLQGRAAMKEGRGPGLTPRRLGEKDGDTTVTLSTSNMAQHTHAVVADNAVTNLSRTPDNHYPANPGGRSSNLYGTTTAATPFKNLANTGGGQAHPNEQPYLVMRYCVALVGVYPPRS